MPMYYKKPDWQEWQYGSTFFNGGYKDYLQDVEKKNKHKVNGRAQKIASNMLEA